MVLFIVITIIQIYNFVLMMQVLMKIFQENLIFQKISQRINHFLNFLIITKGQVQVFKWLMVKSIFCMRLNLIKRHERLPDGKLPMKMTQVNRTDYLYNIDSYFQKTIKEY